MIKPTRDQFRSFSTSRGTSILKAGEYTFLAILLVIGTFVRLFFLIAQSMPRFDPWRHLLLVENLRAGRGFTLFAGQPYIWYPLFWHGFAALMLRALDLDRRWEADFVFERYTLEKVLAGASSAGDLTAFFRGRGVTHLIVNTAQLRARVGGLEAAERALFDEFLASRTDPVTISGDYGIYQDFPQ